MGFIKKHYFGVFIFIFIFVFTAMFLAMILSPSEDIHRRGFIPCTDSFVSYAKTNCSESKACVVKGIMKHIGCSFSVVLDGISYWIDGSQKTPWENYIFEPEIELKNQHLDQENIGELYNENPNLAEEMIEIKKLHEELTVE